MTKSDAVAKGMLRNNQLSTLKKLIKADIDKTIAKEKKNLKSAQEDYQTSMSELVTLKGLLAEVFQGSAANSTFERFEKNIKEAESIGNEGLDWIKTTLKTY